MQTKSRYEVISDLEEQKRSLIREKLGLDDTLKLKQKNLKNLERDVEDKKEEIKDFEKSMKERKEMIKELINGIDASLTRFVEMQKNS